ncbi:efflux RND transporter periplasmic adaptor subunit [Lacrimispora sp. AGF001]|uniref:efflux RND transporter periplasmic adaptor subunit n=1 Tax=Lacrimispora sp. AGF001 TaxID=3401631 RepID=UPI003B42BC68
MKSKKRLVIAVVIIAAAGIIGFGVFGKKKEEIPFETRPLVSAEKPQTGDITLYTDLTGTVEPELKANVMPKMNGEVLEVYFRAGDMVEAGQPLCKIDSDALTTLKINVDSAAIAVTDSQNTLARTEALYTTGAVSHQSLEQAQNGANNARLAYEAAKNQYDLQLKYTTVTAPISGVVESRTVEPHDHITVSSEICKISGTNQIQITFGITEKTLQNMAVNDTVSVEKNGVQYDGTVTEISSVVNSQTGLYDVKAVLADSKGLTTGTRVKITAVMSRAAGVMTIPVDAVSYDASVPFVYCYENGIAKKTEISAGIYDKDKMEIKSGITYDSVVITSWSNELIDGAEVLLEESNTSQETETETPAVAVTKAGE